MSPARQAKTKPRNTGIARPSPPARRRALLSVSDKQGLVEFAAGLVELSYEIVSTGGTAEALRRARRSTAACSRAPASTTPRSRRTPSPPSTSSR